MREGPNWYLQRQTVEDRTGGRCLAYLVLDDDMLSRGRTEIMGYVTVRIGSLDLD